MESQFPEEIPLCIPAPLKAHMEDECFWIVCRQKLLRLPRKPNVDDLLRQFYYHSIATPTEEMNPSLLAEVLDGVKIYFDFMMEDHLLYGPEREQYRLMMDQERARGSHKPPANSHLGPSCEQVEHDSLAQENNLPEDAPSTNLHQSHHSNPHLEHTSSNNPSQLVPSQIYGAEHLLRLFLKFPFFLSRAQLPVSHVQLLHHHFKDILVFLCNRRTELFSEENYNDLTASGEGEMMQPEMEEEDETQQTTSPSTS